MNERQHYEQLSVLHKGLILKNKEFTDALKEHVEYSKLWQFMDKLNPFIPLACV
jgi:hypothetical protein